MSAHVIAHRHADFLECSCGHLAVTETDFQAHREQKERDIRLRIESLRDKGQDAAAEAHYERIREL